MLLVDAALSAGVQFEPGVTAQEPLRSADVASGFSRTRDRVVGVRLVSSAKGEGTSTRRAARIVIAADGRGSRLASTLKLAKFAASPRRWAYGAYFAGVDRLSSHGEMHIRADGYIGIAPLPGGLANVCVVKTPGVLERTPGVTVSFAHVIADAIAGDPSLRERFANARRVSAITVLGPLAMESHAAGCPGLLLAGDAAGFIDPMTGDGLRFALRGGELAAEAALRELESGLPSHDALARARAREFSAKHRVNRALRSLVGSPRALKLAAFVSRYWTGPVEYLIGLAGDVRLAQRSG
jgi:flavin-dependent dehydrogenase